MKNRSFLFVLIFAVFASTTHAQITEMYRQGFESGEAATYTVTSGTANTQTAIYSGGSHSMKLSHVASGTVIELNTIDLSSSADFSHFTLEFMHICDVAPNSCSTNPLVAVIDVKYQGTSSWTQLSQAFYNTEEGGSNQFPWTSSFSNVSYNEWSDGLANNTKWKHERFDLDDYFRGVATVDRKLQIRITLKPNDNGGNANAGWYLDDIVVKASPQAIIKPRLSMVAYPDFAYFPSSRGAQIVADISTTVPQGMCSDSIYVEYQVGSNPTLHKIVMNSLVGQTGRYSARIPFYGYDTVMTWHLVARDATTNHNISTFPKNEAMWEHYACVRGKDNSHTLAPVASLSNGSAYPFPAYGDNRCEFVYDSATLAAAGYRAGAITSLSYTINSAPQAQNRERFQIKMRNVATDYTVSSGNMFTSDFMKIVYDAPLEIEASSEGTVKTIDLQDTFFYAGKDIVIQVTYDNTNINPAATQIKTFVAPAGKQTLYIDGYNANMGFNPFLQEDFFSTATSTEAKRPHFVFTAAKNQPLVYDCGIVSLTYPNYNNAAAAGRNDSVVVWLKNFGAAPMNGVRIAYAVDEGAPVNYNWTGTLAAGDSTRVVLSTSQQFVVGYHSIKAWVGDTITVSGSRYIDHEPYNDTASDEFIACAGSMSGIRQVGGTNADFPTLESFFFSLERCGISGPLTVKLAPGAYDAVSMPVIPGSSTANYIQFEPLSDSVYFLANTRASILLDLRDATHVRFKNIGFRHPQNARAMASLVALSTTSNDCRFENCWFEDFATARVTDLITSGGADSLVVDGCSFHGGTVGVNMTGHASDVRAIGNKILRSHFEMQYTNAVKIVNQTNVVVDSNYMKDVVSNASYILLSQQCYGQSKITANKIFTSHGASALGVADMNGSALTQAIVANNMIVCNDDGTANQMSTPLNIISAQYTKVVYNSVKMTAAQRTNVAAAAFGGGNISNAQFQNNIISCFDNNNFALNFIPGHGTGNVVGHNVYYSQSGILNKYSGSTATSLADWTRLVPMDNASRSANPTFLNGELVDLRSYNQQVKGCGTPITEVTTDMFGSSRDAVAPCAGAFEFVALFYDFNIAALESPESEYCSDNDSIPLNVAIFNSGVNTFDPATSGTLQLSYQCGTQTGSMNVTATIPAADTAVFYSGIKLRLPPNGKNDATYQIKVWLSSTIDPNAVNDTAMFTVLSKYRPSAPNPVNRTVNYGSSTTLQITSGVDQWPVDIYNFGRQRPSVIYWYRDSLDEEPFFKGNTYTTSALYDDTNYFIQQRRDADMMKITEVQISRTGTGVTSPYPAWFASATKVAVELMNVGDAPVNLQGDTLKILNATSTTNTKTFVFPSVTVEAGEAIVIQFGTGSTPDSSATLFTGQSVTWSSTQDVAVLYRDGHGVADAVAFNNITSKTQWTSENVSDAVWHGSGISMTSTAAGVTRTAWPSATLTTPIASTQSWTLSSDSRRMSLGQADPSLIVYRDNGCEGGRSKVSVTLNSRPTTDIALESLVVNEGCGLGMEPVSVDIHNYGAQTCNQVVIHYSVGGEVCSETISTPIVSGGSLSYTFNQLLNLQVPVDTLFNLVVWVDSCEGDFVHVNDTVRRPLESKYTPGIPNVATDHSGDYGSSLTIASLSPIPSNQMLVWFDKHMQALDTIASYTTPLMYNNDTLYVAAIGKTVETSQVGSVTNYTNPTSATTPSPFGTLKKYAKEQYLYTATELTSAGVQAGPINSISFYLDTLMGTSDSVTFSNYTVSLAQTTSATFSNSGNNWVATDPYFSAENFTLTKSGLGWVTLDLDAPFMWNGSSNIVVQICRSMENVVSAGVKTACTNSANRALYKFDDVNASLCDITTAGTRVGTRADIRFNKYIYGCQGPTKELHIAIANVPQYEAAILWPEGTDTMSYSSCGNFNLDVVVSNRGSNTLSNYNLQYSIDGAALTTVPSSSSIAPGNQLNVTVHSQHMMPGRHTLKVIVNADGDVFPENDTVTRTINIRFCGGTYTIGADGDYPDFVSATDTLRNAGVSGAVVFDVVPGVYVGQLQLLDIPGADSENTVTFQSSSDTAYDVVVKGLPSATANYVVNIAEGASHIRFNNIAFRSAGTTNNNNVVVIADANDIRFSNSVICVKPGVDNQSAVCVSLGNNVHDLSFIHCTFDSGYVSLKSSNVTDTSTSGITVDSCRLVHFTSCGIDLANVNDITLHSNFISTGVTISNRKLTGISIDGDLDGLDIQKNNVVIKDEKNAQKMGIVLNNCQGTVVNRILVYNNMVACVGTGNGGNNSCGILIDGTSKFVNVYYNTVALTFASSTATNTASFKTGNVVTNVYALNNNFANFGKGYAYYATANASILTSDYNNYYSSINTKLAYWGADRNTLDALQTANGTDANSLNIQPYFVADDDLHLLIGNLSAHAQYNPDIADDIDGTTRPQIPSPTIGAHEYPVSSHNVTIAEVIKPVLNSTDNVESDPILVKIKVYNNGGANERNVTWYAELDGIPGTTSQTRTIPSISIAQMITDSVYIYPPLGVVDTQTVKIYLNLDSDVEPEDNVAEALVFLSPAFNLRAVSVNIPSGCKLYDAPVTMSIKNEGKKPILGTETITIGYQITLQTSGVTVPNLPIWHEENITLGADLPVGISRDITFSQTANIYPVGVDMNISVKPRAWVAYQYDLKPANDSVYGSNKTSYYTPHAPEGIDLHIPYATSDTIWASQINSRPIRWYRDSTAAPFYAPAVYDRSCHWDNTPQYFHDSIYFLSCISGQCTSDFSAVHVYLNPRVNVDASVADIIQPINNRVYVENDTVRVKIANYGTQPLSNIPIVYQLLQVTGNTRTEIQRVREVYTGTLQPDNYFDFTFDSLLQIPEANVNTEKNYIIRAWTDLNNEMVRINDTNRNEFTFKTLPLTAYCTPAVEKTIGLDITRVSFNSLDWEIPEVGRGYNDFGVFGNPDAPVLHLTRGTIDTLTVECASNDNHEDHRTFALMGAYIDFDRDGSFASNEEVARGMVISRTPAGFVVNVPMNACFGYMKMRIVVTQDTLDGVQPCMDVNKGAVQDFLVYIDENQPQNDITPTRIARLRRHIIDTSDHVVGFMMANKGKDPVSSVTVHYTFDNINQGTIFDSTFEWTGNLAKGNSVYVALPSYDFMVGTTNLTVVLSTAGDNDASNDTLRYEYHLFHVITLSMEDNFDVDPDMWYAPNGDNSYSYNQWQRGTPNKPHITAPYSAPNAWVTGLVSPVSTGKRGSLSTLYSPIIDISTIRCDTLSFMLAKNMLDGSYLTMEYYNYEHHWVKLDASSVIDWYDDENGFSGTSSGYVLYKFATSVVSGEFPEQVQFRFVYFAQPGAQNTTSYGDGCAIDDFSIKRARRSYDVGVLAITHPTEPKFGQTICPTVTIINYGLDTVRNVAVAYRPYGSYMPREENYTGVIAPNGGTASFTFSEVNAFVVTNNYPDTFQMCAFTRSPSDLYHDNDTACGEFHLFPLDNDMSMEAFISPLPRIVAGDSAVVTVRLRNFGQVGIPSAKVVAVFNGGEPVEETVNFQDLLGRDLASTEFFNYTFHQKFRASMGTMSLVTYCRYDNDDYLFNDTISMRLDGISAITDLKAREVIVDTSNQQYVRVQIVVDNVGARAANNFEVGFYIDNDTSTVFRQIYATETGISSLSMGSIIFDTLLPTRTARYDHVCGFVHIDGDNDPTNDTTTTIARQYVDIKVNKLLIEENRYDTCHVRMQVENIGNLNLTRTYRISATINGVTINSSLSRAIAPGEVYHLDFDATIPKSSNRTYVGSGKFSCSADVNSDNNQTSLIEIQNYFEGIPLVEGDDGFALGQNYPNPFHTQTSVEFVIPVAGDVRFFVTDLVGRMVYQDVKRYEAGTHQVTIPSNLLPSGVYFYGIECAGHRLMRKCVKK